MINPWLEKHMHAKHDQKLKKGKVLCETVCNKN